MKKSSVKIFRQEAAALVPIHHIAVRRELVKETDEVTGESEVILKKKYVGIAVNHARRLRKAYQQGGEAGMTAYLEKVERATQQNNIMLR
jgi:hypothetical protein